MNFKDNSNQLPFFKLYHELMAYKVGEILLISSPYDAFIMEEEGQLSTRIINEYKGLNLSRPPKLTWISSTKEAFEALEKKKYDLILAMPGLESSDIFDFGIKVKEKYSNIPFFMLLHNTCENDITCQSSVNIVDRTYIWGGNADLLLAIIKNFEDEKNVNFDTKNAKVRVIILVEDSPHHFSSFLPVLYKQIVKQTQFVIDESINEEQRILKMRGRPKVLLANNYEQAISLYQKYKPYLLSVFSDMRYQKDNRGDETAGYKLLTQIKKQSPDMPVLILSTEESNRKRADKIPAAFINKNAGNLNEQIHNFFVSSLGFGDFVFKMPDGKAIARAADLRSMERILPSIPEQSIVNHADNHDFSRWLIARHETEFAVMLMQYKTKDFKNPKAMKQFLIDSINTKRRGSSAGHIISFSSNAFDSNTGFIKIGKGSLGGKARGLAFMALQIKRDSFLQDKFKDIDIVIPQTFVIATQGFKDFIQQNKLAKILDDNKLSDKEIADRFVKAKLPDWLLTDLKTYLLNVRYPIAVRSSSLFEDAHFQPFAGLYDTYMLSNKHLDITKRLEKLAQAIKLVYASTYFKAPRSYAKSTMYRTDDEEMAIVLQQLIGTKYKNYFYPAISGLVQSYNFYPIAHLKSEDGIAHIALGLGRTVMEGGKCLRFCPKYPQFLPQFSIIEDILENSQKTFYALKLEGADKHHLSLEPESDSLFEKLDVFDKTDHSCVRILSSTFDHQDNKLRDSFSSSGFPILTFANILKYNSLPLPQILSDVSEIGSKWMGGSVEIEFAITLPEKNQEKPKFALLQIRPMGRYIQNFSVEITKKDIKQSFCYSTCSLGNGRHKNICDIVYVDPKTFDPSQTIEIASQINKMNALFNETKKKYVLIGPGRWGSADKWLGIPVVWNDISNVGVMLETTIESIKADPSQGSHFFQNITSLGISYITIRNKEEDFIDYDFLKSHKCANTTNYLKHIEFKKPLKILVDGKTSRAVLIQK